MSVTSANGIEIAYDDRERALEKFGDLDRRFTRAFLNDVEPKRPSELLQAARALTSALAQTPEHAEAMRRLRAAVENAR